MFLKKTVMAVSEYIFGGKVAIELLPSRSHESSNASGINSNVDKDTYVIRDTQFTDKRYKDHFFHTKTILIERSDVNVLLILCTAVEKKCVGGLNSFNAKKTILEETVTTTIREHFTAYIDAVVRYNKLKRQDALITMSKSYTDLGYVTDLALDIQHKVVVEELDKVRMEFKDLLAFVSSHSSNIVD